MTLRWEDRFPFLDSRGREQLRLRYRACASDIAAKMKLPVDAVLHAKELGCGNYGCTFLIAGLPRDRAVFKVTTDNLEANAASLIASWGEEAPDGIVRIHGVYRLGKCSVLPKMRPFEYTKTKYTGYGTQKTKIYHRDSEGSYRPAWVVWREELEDAWPHLQKRGVKLKELKALLDDDLFTYIDQYASEHTSFRRSKDYHRNVDRNSLYERLARVKGQDLLLALEWLVDHDLVYLDFRKVINLGWRDGTGLVIRDIGATEAGSDYMDDIDKIGAARGRARTKTATNNRTR